MPRRKRKMRCLSWFEPTAELHQNPKPFEGRSTDWATAPRRSRRKIKKAALENSFWRMSFAFSFWRISKLWVKKGFVIDRRRDENNRNLFDHLLRWQNNPSITKRIFFSFRAAKKVWTIEWKICRVTDTVVIVVVIAATHVFTFRSAQAWSDLIVGPHLAKLGPSSNRLIIVSIDRNKSKQPGLNRLS